MRPVWLESIGSLLPPRKARKPEWQLLVLLVTSLLSQSCATQQQTPRQLELEAGVSVALREIYASGPIIAQPDLSYWDELTSSPDHDFGWLHDGWSCGLTNAEPVGLGQWNLVGISSNSVYTPVLDIISDRTGKSVKNDTTYYYHFQLSIIEN